MLELYFQSMRTISKVKPCKQVMAKPGHIEGYKQLRDPLFYRHVDKDLSKQHMNEIALRVENQDCEIDETVKLYLIAVAVLKVLPPTKNSQKKQSPYW